MYNILIADDSEELLEMLRYIYKRSKYIVTTALSKKELFAHLKKITPDLILLDVMLKFEDGRQICKELKTSQEYRNIPVILISASPGKLINYLDFYADDIIEKPFSMETVLTKVKEIISSSKEKKIHSEKKMFSN
jgi:DNA-binding response OmpR family regulator